MPHFQLHDYLWDFSMRGYDVVSMRLCKINIRWSCSMLVPIHRKCLKCSKPAENPFEKKRTVAEKAKLCYDHSILLFRHKFSTIFRYCSVWTKHGLFMSHMIHLFSIPNERKKKKSRYNKDSIQNRKASRPLMCLFLWQYNAKAMKTEMDLAHYTIIVSNGT